MSHIFSKNSPRKEIVAIVARIGLTNLVVLGINETNGITNVHVKKAQIKVL